MGGVGQRLEAVTARDLLPFMAIFQQTLSGALIPRTSADSHSCLPALYVSGNSEGGEIFDRHKPAAAKIVVHVLSFLSSDLLWTNKWLILLVQPSAEQA